MLRTTRVPHFIPAIRRTRHILQRLLPHLASPTTHRGAVDLLFRFVCRAGTPQHIFLDFGRPVVPTAVRLMFQGGFVAKELAMLAAPAHTSDPNSEGGPAGATAAPGLEKLADAWPADESTLQEFVVPCEAPVTQLKLVFNGSTDFYGRVTVYKLEVLGS